MFVAVTVALGFADGAEHEVVAFGFQDDGRWEDVPGSFGNDVGGEAVDGSGAIALPALLQRVARKSFS